MNTVTGMAICVKFQGLSPNLRSLFLLCISVSELKMQIVCDVLQFEHKYIWNNNKYCQNLFP